MKFQILVLALLGGSLLWGNYYRQTATSLREQKETYRQTSELLLTKIRNIYDEKIKLEQQNQKLEEEALKDKENFDWNADISDTYVIRSLRSK